MTQSQVSVVRKVESSATVKQLREVLHLGCYARVRIQVQVAHVEWKQLDLLNLEDSRASHPGDRPLSNGLDRDQKVVPLDVGDSNYAVAVVILALEVFLRRL